MGSRRFLYPDQGRIESGPLSIIATGICPQPEKAERIDYDKETEAAMIRSDLLNKTFRSVRILIGGEEFDRMIEQSLMQADQAIDNAEATFCELLKSSAAAIRFPFLPELGMYCCKLSQTLRGENASGLSVDELAKLPLNESTVMYLANDYKTICSEYDLHEIQKAILNNYIIETDRRSPRFLVFAKHRDQVHVGSFPIELKASFERLVKGDSILRALTFDPGNPDLNVQPLIGFLAQFQLIKSIQIQSKTSPGVAL